MSETCQNWLRSHRQCGETLRPMRTKLGTTRHVCLRCMARDAGRCWQCGKEREKTSDLAIYCNGCGQARIKASTDASRQKPEQKARRKAYDQKRYSNRAA